ncbi:MAG: exopolysaccharide biosynthesis polyprenyl glycosylphosphotransferase [Candidatus Binataceae bacterium]|jgi:exopolysaccharide biosynthesis polyprenyl glycosylphosphotransferase
MYYRPFLPVLSLAGGMAALTVAAHLPGLGVQLHPIDTLLGVALFAYPISSLGARRIANHLRQRQGRGLRRVLIVGTRAQAESYLTALDKSLELVQVLGYLYIDHGRLCLNGNALSDDIERVDSVLEDLAVDEVVLASPDALLNSEDLLHTCATRGIIFRTLIRMPNVGLGKYVAMTLSGGDFLLSIETVPRQPLLLAAKRLVDIVGALFGLAICAVVYAICALRIRRETHGDVFFKQTRVGRNGRLFTLYKLRTMYVDAEYRLPELLKRNEMKGHIFKMREDPRVTQLGRILRRHHIDELPQFWNVLRGDMSLVGTRPPTCSEVSQYEPHHRRRLSMKPGITGLWQLRGNAAVSDFEEIVGLDCHYIDNWSLFLDLKVLLATVFLSIRGNGC